MPKLFPHSSLRCSSLLHIRPGRRASVRCSTAWPTRTASAATHHGTTGQADAVLEQVRALCGQAATQQVPSSSQSKQAKHDAAISAGTAVLGGLFAK